MIFDSGQQPALLQIVQYLLSRLVAVQPCIRPAVFVDAALIIHHVDLWKVVAQACLEVVGIVGGSHLYRAAAEFRIGKFIRDNRNLALQ